MASCAADSSHFEAITDVMADPFCIEMVVLEVLEHKYCTDHTIISVSVPRSM